MEKGAELWGGRSRAAAGGPKSGGSPSDGPYSESESGGADSGDEHGASGAVCAPPSRGGGGREGRGAPAAPIVLPEAAPAPPAPSLPAAGAPSAGGRGGPGEVASPARRRRRQQRGLPGGAPAPPRGAGLGRRRGRSPLPFLPPLCVADVGMRVGAEYQARIPDFEPGKIAFFWS